jgi:hypothetical protein
MGDGVNLLKVPFILYIQQFQANSSWASDVRISFPSYGLWYSNFATNNFLLDIFMGFEFESEPLRTCTPLCTWQPRYKSNLGDTAPGTDEWQVTNTTCVCLRSWDLKKMSTAISCDDNLPSGDSCILHMLQYIWTSSRNQYLIFSMVIFPR